MTHQDAHRRALEAKARRIAAREGHTLHKALGQLGPENLGEFMLANEQHHCVLGAKFDACPEDVIAYFAG